MYRALTLALILSLLGCSDQTDTLRIGANRWLGYGPLYLADDLHWMTPSGYRLVEYPHTTGVLRGYRNRLLDAALLTLDEALILQSSGQPVQILLVADVSAGADVLFANAHIQQLAQLRGQRIGVENSALGAFFLSRILDLAKLPASDISVIDMPVNEHLHALRTGQIDAAINFASASASFAPPGCAPAAGQPRPAQRNHRRAGDQPAAGLRPTGQAPARTVVYQPGTMVRAAPGYRPAPEPTPGSERRRTSANPGRPADR